MRHSCLLLVLFLFVGCTSTSERPSSDSKELAATLSFVAGDRPLDSGSGIYSVGGSLVPGAPSKLVKINSGRRNISYNCPGFVFVDAAPSIRHEFHEGLSYEMYCQNGDPVFRIKPVPGA